MGVLVSVYPATKRSGRPSSLTSPTAAPVCQPKASIPASRAPSVNVPSPSFQRSASKPSVPTLKPDVVTYRSVWPSRSRSAATQPLPRNGRAACGLTAHVLETATHVSEQSAPWQLACRVVLLRSPTSAYAFTTKRSSQPSLS